jgi:hypothetical protein
MSMPTNCHSPVKKIFEIDYGLLNKSVDSFEKKTDAFERCLVFLS